MTEKKESEFIGRCDDSLLVSMHHMSVSDALNQLKAKLYNVVEASVTDDGQRRAMRGLIKGFCNEAFRYMGNGITSAHAMHGNLKLDMGTEDYWLLLSENNPNTNTD